MDWNLVAHAAGGLVLKNAPLIGSVLGGLLPIPGGSAIGQEAGQILASTLGVPATPEAVGKALAEDPQAATKVAAAEAELSGKYPAMAEQAKALFEGNSAQAASVNDTMRAELAAGAPWYHWRNLYGYSVALEATATSWIILYSLVLAPELFKNVSDSMSFFLSWYALRFGLLGYIHNQASNEKVAAVTGSVPSAIAQVVKAVRGK